MKFSEITEVSVKAGPGDIPAPQNVIPDAIPQERFTGDVMQGRGPRRGNLERLLRYWRPIMRKEGGFRRCRVILANHPELFPLNNICAWLHHETTGLWPNEGCHHPGMKNCRNKLKKGVRGSIWNDNEWERRMDRLPGAGKALPYGDMGQVSSQVVVTLDDLKHAMVVLRDFVEMEPEFAAYLRDDQNWEHVGTEADGVPDMPHEWMKPEGQKDCDCGCGGN